MSNAQQMEKAGELLLQYKWIDAEKFDPLILNFKTFPLYKYLLKE